MTKISSSKWNDAWFTWPKNIVYNIILKARKQLLIGIPPTTATISKRVFLGGCASAWVPRDILDSPLLACLPVLGVLLALIFHSPWLAHLLVDNNWVVAWANGDGQEIF